LWWEEKAAEEINNDKTATNMPQKATNPQNLKDKGFDKRPENINRKGRPKKLPGLDEILANVLGTDGLNKSEAEKIIEALKNKALKGDVKAAELLLERGYGKVRPKIDANINIPQIQKVIYE